MQATKFQLLYFHQFIGHGSLRLWKFSNSLPCGRVQQVLGHGALVTLLIVWLLFIRAETSP